MTDIVDRFRWVWTHLAWLVATIIVMLDPRHVEEWAKQHEVWGGLIVAAFTALLVWANKQRSSPPTPSVPTNRGAQGRVA